MPGIDHAWGLLMADAGFDVWMGNSRGNVYSRDHATLNPKKREYWKFSFEEMAQFDVPANINYILKWTGRPSLAYSGHSQGTTQFFAAMTLYPELHEKVWAFCAFGPVAYMKHSNSTLLKMGCHMRSDSLQKLFGRGEYLSLLGFIPETVPALLSEMPYLGEPLLKIGMSSIIGYNKHSTDIRRMSIYMAHEPNGTSMQNIKHWAQAVRSGRFCRMDRGKKENLKRGGTRRPKAYDTDVLKTLPFPLFMYVGGRDPLTSPRDFAHLRSHFCEDKIEVTVIPDYVHLCMIWGTTAAEKCYIPAHRQLLSAHAAHFGLN